MKNKRVGILTHPLSKNYGGIMQAWALQQVVKNLGYTPQTIDWDYRPKWKYFFRGLPGALFAKLQGRNVDWPHTPGWSPTNQRGLRQFIIYNLLMSKRIDFNAIIPFVRKKYKTVIVGSDQVWRQKYIPIVETMFLPYEKKKGCKKIAYAASFGTDDWEYTDDQTRACVDLISDFDAISVREKSGVDLCKKKLHFANAEWVLDPTLLLEKSKYESLCSEIERDNTGYVFAYILDKNPDLLKLAKDKATDLNIPLKVISVDDEVRSTDTVENWLAAFRDAKYVVTDSFHGTVFSLIFKKKFAVYKNKARGNTRFDNLLQLFPQINNSLISENKLPETDIDWQSIEKICCKYKQSSINFLEKALNKG